MREHIGKCLPDNKAIHEKVEPVDDDISNNVDKDKGYAWIISIGGCLGLFATFGALSSYGVFLNFYLNNDVFPSATKYDYAFIGGIVLLLGQSLAPFVVLIANFVECRSIVIAGTILYALAFMMASISNQIWQLYITQGLMPGIAISFIFIPITLVVPTWFDKYLSTGMGIVQSGSGLGGVAISLSLNAVINKTGNQKWALRMQGFIVFFCCIVLSIIIKPRVPATLIKFNKTNLLIKLKKQFDFSVFKSYPVVILAFWFAIVYTGYTVLSYSLAPYARLVGLSPTQGANLTTILNATQVIGRPLIGFLADMFGRNNTTSVVNIILLILVFGFWINVESYQALIPFSLLMGMVCGVGPTMAQSLVSDVVKSHERLIAAWSGFNVFAGIVTLFGEPITLALVRENSSKPYLHAQIFIGMCFLSGTILLIIVRESLVRNKLNEECEDNEEPDKTSTNINFNLLQKSTSVLTRIFYPMKV